MRYLHIKDDFGDKYHWKLVLENLKDLRKYMPHRVEFVTKGVKDYYESKYNNLHYKTTISAYIAQMKQISDNQLSVDDIIDKAINEYYTNIQKFINDGSTVYINSSQGILPLKEDVEFDDEVESDGFFELQFKNTDIKTLKWEDGGHYYCKIGNYDVVIDNEQKWNTEKEAIVAGEIFLKQLNEDYFR